MYLTIGSSGLSLFSASGATLCYWMPRTQSHTSLRCAHPAFFLKEWCTAHPETRESCAAEDGQRTRQVTRKPLALAVALARKLAAVGSSRKNTPVDAFHK
ncbi:hypothetical protein PR003_g26130 [Phytophthora rubi]|uniref:Uncharacterized protein n=1 Tax=Phytophthora rubi TaxID=129364 RepID=A0A6A3HZ61_9STRA|nr:hypothetical protein PR001_g26870 [Phytophthora rubi]KAE8974921.1 hypothetical protein PR002_g25759 [Phytophthora rubi]KAE9287117.1 hypothetical protein PR003_g26130 [Phytophthora rubi]